MKKKKTLASTFCSLMVKMMLKFISLLERFDSKIKFAMLKRHKTSCSKKCTSTMMYRKEHLLLFTEYVKVACQTLVISCNFRNTPACLICITLPILSWKISFDGFSV